MEFTGVALKSISKGAPPSSATIPFNLANPPLPLALAQRPNPAPPVWLLSSRPVRHRSQHRRSGTRLATLVTRGGRTKQATAELAGQLVRHGYLELHADPTDGRAKLYVPTSAGTDLLTVCAGIVVRYEA